MSDELGETKYKAYLDQRQALIDIEVDASNRLDRGILTLAGGALGLSVTFIEKIAPHPLPSTLWLLAVSWLLFLVTLLASLASHLTSQSAMRRQRDILGLDLEKETLTEDEKRNPMNSATHWLNIGSMLTFSVGVILLCIFTLCNLPRKESPNAGKEATDRQTTTQTDNRESGSAETSKTATTAKEGEVDMSNGGIKKDGMVKPSGTDKRAGVVAPQNAKPAPKPPPPPPPADSSKKK